MTSYKQHFSRFLATRGDRLHFAAHSHHLWPDVTYDAQIRAWDLASLEVDEKWETLLGEVMPRTRRGIAGVLGLSQPDRLAFAPNTHEFLTRIVSSFPHDRPVRLLSTDSEFHSFARQCRRWIEAGAIELTTVPVEPFDTFDARFLEAAASEDLDLVFVSHVFFSSGYVFQRYAELIQAVPRDETILVLDGYHGFMALPTDLASVEDRIFYLSGGYKYAMSGEGVCFLHCPDGYVKRPVDTGWFASFGELESATGQGPVSYGAGGQRMFGSTFDPTAILRMSAVFDLFDEVGLDPGIVHAHVQKLQRLFLDRLESADIPGIHTEQLVPGREYAERGHFLTFRSSSAGELYSALRKLEVITDFRGENLRFGFGIYHDESDVEQLVERMRSGLRPKG